ERNRRALRQVALQKRPPQAARLERSRGDHARPQPRVLPQLAKPARDHRQGQAFPAGRLCGRNRAGARRIRPRARWRRASKSRVICRFERLKAMGTNLGLILALASLFLVAGAFAWTKMTGRPLPPTMERAVAFAGTLLAVAAFLLHPGAVGYVVAGIGLLLGGFFSFLTFVSGLPDQRAAVAVGSKAPDFGSVDADGHEFRLSGFEGSRVLLKFFRGTWCPYCVADLRLWSERQKELRELGLKLVAVSHDSVEDLRRFRRGHDWEMTLVADPDLEIIRRYNLQNRNFTPKGGPF